MVRPSASPCVPQRLVGVWSRKLFTTAEGHRDDTSVALWLQTDTCFGDLRIPASCLRPAGHTGPWLPSDEVLDEQISFAGHAVLASDNATCSWSQYLNRGTSFLPGGPPVLEPPQLPDCATLTWVADDLLHEVRRAEGSQGTSLYATSPPRLTSPGRGGRLLPRDLGPAA